MRRPTAQRALALVATAALLGTTAPAASAATSPSAGTTAEAETAAGAPQQATDTPALVDGLAEPVDAALAPDKAAKAHLAGHKDRYKIADPSGTLVTASVDTEGTRETVRLDQQYQGLPVFGAQYVVRMEKKGGTRTVTGTSGTYYTHLDVDTSAAGLTADQAVARAVQDVRRSLHPGAAVVAGGVRPGTKPGAAGSGLTGKDQGLVVMPSGTGALARHVLVSGSDAASGQPVARDVYVSATSGVTLLSVSRIKTVAAPQQVAPAAGAAGASTAPQSVTEPAPSGTGVTQVVGEGTTLHGATVPLPLERVDGTGTYLTVDLSHSLADGRTVPITTWDARAQDYYTLAYTEWPEDLAPFAAPSSSIGGELTDAGAVDAAWDAAKVFEWWNTELGRNSLDDAGMPINSLVGITYGGNPFVNAYWDGTRMVYGTGDAEYLPLAADLDVVGHEMTHGVVEHTANLVYAGQPGALNEAIADYFGNAIDVDASGQSMSDPQASLLGGDLCRTLGPTDCAFRNLDDGATTASFQHLMDTPQMDDGGVHLNSTIVSGALWDLRQAFGGAVADKIVYRALTDYLTPSADFVDARDAVIASATSFGLKGKDLKTVQNAFDSRGITAKWESSLYGKGTTMLVDRLNTGMYHDMQASIAGGYFAVAREDDNHTEAPSIWVGRTDASVAPYRISPNDGNYHGFAQTDGKRVVWLTVGYDAGSPTGEVDRILSAPVQGGEVKELYRTYWPISGLGADSDLVAWSELDSTQYLDVVHYLKGRSSTVHTVEHDWFGPATAPSVKDGRISYVRYEVFLHPQDSSWDWALGAEVYDTATGTTTLAGLDPGAETMSYPSLSSTGVAWVTDTDEGTWTADGPSQAAFNDSVRLFDFATGTSRLLFDENSPQAVRADVLTLSDTTLTITEEAPVEVWMATNGYPSDALNPKLQQYTFDGTYVGPASCSPGAQMFATAGLGRTVVYKDSSAAGFGLAIATGVKSCK
ncbi:M4 family metallopeptidase [Xylanimonas sp. McL0601]|uniref:M4 family metallopeptidase n=1 Tax=Xylanimonas sp. McL0601 TaxID=3414739 RepID=UPI003CF34B23